MQQSSQRMRSNTVADGKRFGLKQPSQLKKPSVKSPEKKTTDHSRKLAQPTNRETINANKGLKRPASTKVCSSNGKSTSH